MTDEFETPMPVRKPEPTWMYRSGAFGKTESRCFDHPDDVPPDKGWVDSPARVQKGNAQNPAGAGKATAKSGKAGRKKSAN